MTNAERRFYRLSMVPVAHSPEKSDSAKSISTWTGTAREQAVQRMFTGIARFYDLNNSLLSFGLHHLWKKRAVRGVTDTGGRALDLGAGTGDLAILLNQKIGPSGQVVAADLNEAMLRVGLQKIQEKRLEPRISCFQMNAEYLTFQNDSFHTVTAGFCVRNVGDHMRAFKEIHRVLQPGGRFICLEFSRPTTAILRKLYDVYSFRLLPWIGTVVARDGTGVYEYLPASIRTFPDQERLRELLLKAGFQHVDYQNLSGGIVAIHTAVK
ncbi:MAG: bifunctional demethylmenaquinone methyltransferase/2-methoxy-6-polyprenyl-1,4-benzoquinol methylase UbiE [Nitrospirales bacterium]|nr:bifunctional demethylmenaquinone methyltransferase/2-methoxy-6-polyprenyl-1,4-benzoquinol methylase UbiE [Nitrospirales bacterium]